MKINEINFKIIYSFCLIYFLLYSLSYAETDRHVSLYSYSGYLTTPSAYITEGHLGLHYTYLPKKVAAYRKEISDNWIFSSSLGFLPFMEFYFSVYIAPSTKWIYNYGSGKTRSPGVKLKILNEKKYMPTVAFGIFDPNIQKFGGDFSYDNISSTFCVLSKKLFSRQSSISVGYGFNISKGKYARLKGFFGGININVYKKLSLVIDYDSENWSEGISAEWNSFDIVIAIIGDSSPAYRIGYNINLLNKKSQ